MKDLFSGHAESYAQARPVYPQVLMDYVLQHCVQRDCAWDCATGSGQFARLMAGAFHHIEATDLSAKQLANAPQFANINYTVQVAEQTNFPDHFFDFVAVAQAIHWFDFDAFYQELKRVLKPEGLFAVIGYGLIEIEDVALNSVIQQLYHQTLQGYWDAERRYIDELYATIPFPLNEIAIPAAEKAQMNLSYTWSISQLYDYLNTWSAVKHYQHQNQSDPLACLAPWLGHDTMYQLHFPLLLRLGRF